MERVILNVFTVSASISAVRMLILVTSDGNSKIFKRMVLVLRSAAWSGKNRDPGFCQEEETGGWKTIVRKKTQEELYS